LAATQALDTGPEKCYYVLVLVCFDVGLEAPGPGRGINKLLGSSLSLSKSDIT